MQFTPNAEKWLFLNNETGVAACALESREVLVWHGDQSLMLDGRAKGVS
jgi:hypothetical protein